jgi:DUF1680 family protein
VEAFERLGEGTFYHEADTLWVTQFVASALDWSEKAVTVELDADYPFPDPVRIVVRCDAPTSFSLRVRVPKWAREPRASLNEAGLEIDGEWMVILRRWQDGDLLQLEFPMSLNVKSMPDDASMVAFQYGPHVLAALTDRPLELASGVTPRRTPDGWQVCLRDGTDVRLVPLSEVVDEVFGVYFRVRS